AEDGIRDLYVTGVQTCALPICGWPAWFVLGAMAVASMLIGGGWIGIVGALRHYRGINEPISSLLLSYIGVAIFSHLVEGPLRDPASLNKPSTSPIGDAYSIGSIPGLDV